MTSVLQDPKASYPEEKSISILFLAKFELGQGKVGFIQRCLVVDILETLCSPNNCGYHILGPIIARPDKEVSIFKEMSSKVDKSALLL